MTLGTFVKMFVIVYVLAVVFESISRFPYYHGRPRRIAEWFRSILLRCLILTTIFMISTLVWFDMGWMPKSHG